MKFELCRLQYWYKYRVSKYNMAYSYGIHNNIQSFKYIWFQKHCCLTTSNDVATQNLFTETLIFFELTIVMFTNNIKLYK